MWVLNAWGAPQFDDILRQEVETLRSGQWPLQQGLSRGNHVLDRYFYAGVIAGCSCTGDPAPVDELSEYCEVRIEIDQHTAETTATLLTE